MILLLSYNTLRDSEKRTSIVELLKTSKSWWHYLDNTWLIEVESMEDMKKLQLRIINKIGDENPFIIIDITGKKNCGLLPVKAWEWLEKHK